MSLFDGNQVKQISRLSLSERFIHFSLIDVLQKVAFILFSLFSRDPDGRLDRYKTSTGLSVYVIMVDYIKCLNCQQQF